MTYPPPSDASDSDSTPSLHKDGAPTPESTAGNEAYPPPYPGAQHGGEHYPNSYPGPQYGDQQYAPTPPGAPQYGTPSYGQGQFGAPSYGAYGAQPPYGFPVVAQTNGKAIASLVCGIAAFLTCLLFIGIPAVILGNLASAEIEASGGTQDGAGMAQAGKVLGWIAIALTVISLVAFLILLIIGASST